ncbi:glycosyltransferase [Marinobacter sp.]|uniref:glycosyltransferase n=1 Tax=Marinobacter sp. TaxID=50741 RepID=UPI003A92F9AF
MMSRPDVPLLSVVVLVYNTADYLQACFDSLIGQTYPNIEILAVDDASTDTSLAICREYESRHSNFRCISKANEGGAVSGNLGVSLATGKYVAIVDSDDVVMPDAYAHMITRAEEAAADIVVGRAARLIDRQMSAVAFLYEPFVWAAARELDSIHQYPELMHDGFYWNKVFRTRFLREHGLGMLPGLLYADRPFVHRAYLLSRKTVVITDLVYLWRQRDAATSITQLKARAANFQDRMRSVALEWQEFADDSSADAYRRLIAVFNLQRALHVINDILASEEFCQVFIEGIQGLLKLFGDLDYQALGVRRVAYLELIRRDDLLRLKRLLSEPADITLVEHDGSCFWQPAQIEGAGLDAKLLRIDFPTIGFFSIADLIVEDGILLLDLQLHDSVQARSGAYLELQSLTGQGAYRFKLLGAIAPNLQRFAAPCATLKAFVDRPDGLFGIVLSYEVFGIVGRYRLGPSLLSEAARSRLPLACGDAHVVDVSRLVGGLGVTARPSRYV